MLLVLLLFDPCLRLQRWHLAFERHVVAVEARGHEWRRLRQREQHHVVRQRGGLALQPVLAHDVGAVRQPVGRRKVDRLRHVEARVEARVVGAREGDDKGAGRVHEAVAGHAARAQLRGRQHGDQAVQQQVVLLKEMRQGVTHRHLKRERGLRGHAIPHLGCARVQVVDRVQRVVLDVPAERRQARAHVQPRHHDARDEVVALHVAQQRRAAARDVVDIPRVSLVLARVRVELDGPARPRVARGVAPDGQREARAVAAAVQI
mmetsp:Transcript_36375/g.91841  ORF Transcript_36375/g.91841 Transcript_36375/m.91841 type:complete len:262 (+) Transcript_36375:3189-3974(+)